MIDADGYRANVGIVVVNHCNKVLLAKRIGENAWQLPQGGIDIGESDTDALYRELKEEVGLNVNDVELIAKTTKWLRYKLPQRKSNTSKFVGQKQIWFLLRLICDEKHINLKTHDNAEFDDWKWVDFWQPIEFAIHFKKAVYEDMLKALASFLFDKNYPVPSNLNRSLVVNTISLK